MTGTDTFLNQLEGQGTLCLWPAPGYQVAVTVKHVGTDYVRAVDAGGHERLFPLGVIAWWAPK
jgi:hypothetical protein